MKKIAIVMGIRLAADKTTAKQRKFLRKIKALPKSTDSTEDPAPEPVLRERESQGETAAEQPISFTRLQVAGRNREASQ